MARRTIAGIAYVPVGRQGAPRASAGMACVPVGRHGHHRIVGIEQEAPSQQADVRPGRPGEADVIRLGLIAAPDLPTDLARDLAEDLPAVLHEHVSREVRWLIPVVTDRLGANERMGGSEIVERARERMLREGWNLAICITDLPLRNGHRPVVADASAMHGVGLICLPALGAVHLRRRTRDAIVRLVDGLVGESMERHARDRRDAGDRRRRVSRALTGIAASVRRVVPDDEDVDVRFVTAAVRGNLRLLTGMVRANRPWRLLPGLSYALAAAVGVGAFGLLQSDVWRLADVLGPVRLVALMLVSMLATIVSLIAAHDLWERAVDDRMREQAVLFNVATTATITLGVLCLYAALFVLTLGATGLLLTTGALSRAVGHHASMATDVSLAWMVTSLATVGGALGVGLEDDTTVRQAAYGYRPDHQTEAERGAHRDPGS